MLVAWLCQVNTKHVIGWQRKEGKFPSNIFLFPFFEVGGVFMYAYVYVCVHVCMCMGELCKIHMHVGPYAGKEAQLISKIILHHSYTLSVEARSLSQIQSSLTCPDLRLPVPSSQAGITGKLPYLPSIYRGPKDRNSCLYAVSPAVSYWAKSPALFSNILP